MERDTGTSLTCLASATFRPAEFVFCPTISLSSPRGAAEFCALFAGCRGAPLYPLVCGVVAPVVPRYGASDDRGGFPWYELAVLEEAPGWAEGFDGSYFWSMGVLVAG